VMFVQSRSAMDGCPVIQVYGQVIPEPGETGPDVFEIPSSSTRTML
jgi:hypothetical protein